MLLGVFFKIILAVVIIQTNAKKYSQKEGKVVLKPAELIDLILEEQMRRDMPAAHRRSQKHAMLSDTQKNPFRRKAVKASNEEYNDDLALRTRKVWSRWSKWGECSARCGPGEIVRRRICVAGRCAPGELEEQRRPCIRTPCISETPVIDELHEE